MTIRRGGFTRKPGNVRVDQLRRRRFQIKSVRRFNPVAHQPADECDRAVRRQVGIGIRRQLPFRDCLIKHRLALCKTLKAILHVLQGDGCELVGVLAAQIR